MPAYNESTSIERNIIEAAQTLSSFGYDYEIIVVDDGSLDDTYLYAVRVKSHYPERVRVVRYDRNQGKGHALICGASYASGEIVAFLDADMDLHPAQLLAFIEIMDLECADVVIGSKRHRLSSVNYPAERRLLSAGYFFLVRALFGLPVRDTQTGLKVFRVEVLRRVFPRVLVKRFAFDIEVLANAHRLGYKIVEAPVTLKFQRAFSRIRLKDIWEILIDTLVIFYRLRITHSYDRGAEHSVFLRDRTSREVFYPSDFHDSVTAGK